MSNHETATCGVCGEPMPAGEEMFMYHGYSGPCPKDAVVIAAEEKLSSEEVGFRINNSVQLVHERNVKAGWWTDQKTGESLIGKRNVPEMLCLVHSEISEAMEGHRKGLMDDKLPHRPMIEVELADAVIRILDMAGGLGLDLGGAVAEKLEVNRHRADHKPENRVKAGGKAY